MDCQGTEREWSCLMGRKAEEPLEKKDVSLFIGDWDRLAAVLAPRRISPTVFIRKLVRRTLTQIEAKAAFDAKPVLTEISDDIIDGALAESTDDSQPGQPGASIQPRPGPDEG